MSINKVFDKIDGFLMKGIVYLIMFLVVGILAAISYMVLREAMTTEEGIIVKILAIIGGTVLAYFSIRFLALIFFPEEEQKKGRKK